MSNFLVKLCIIVDWMPDHVRHDENQSGLFRHSGIQDTCHPVPTKISQFRHQSHPPYVMFGKETTGFKAKHQDYDQKGHY